MVDDRLVAEYGVGRQGLRTLTVCATAVALAILSLPSGAAVILALSRGAPVSVRIVGTVKSAAPAVVPVVGASVTLSEVYGSSRNQVATTDAAGSFGFADVRAGRYYVSASNQGFLNSSYGAARPGQLGSLVAVAGDRDVLDLTITMWKGAAVSGSIRDRSGAALLGLRVTLLSRETDNGGRDPFVSPELVTKTDDQGRYRFYGLLPGDYVVATSPGSAGSDSPLHQVSPNEVSEALNVGAQRGQPSSGGGSARELVVSVPVYYPGTPSASAATSVRVAAGDDLAGIDFQMAPVRAVAVSGRVYSELTDLIPRITLALDLTTRPANQALVIRRDVPVGVDGHFGAVGLAAGEYTLLALGKRAGSSGSTSTGSPGLFWGKTDLDVSGSDLPDVSIILHPALTLVGHVVFNGEGVSGERNPKVTIRLAAVSQSVLMNRVRSQTDAMGTFRLNDLVPGSYRLSVEPSAGSRNAWTLVAATLGEKDILGNLLQLPEDYGDQELTLVLSDRPTELRGVLKDSLGYPTNAYFVLVFPADRNLWAFGSTRIRQVRPATDGEFLFSGLPPGDYFVASVADAIPLDHYDPALLKDLQSAGVLLRLADGERKRQDLRLIRH